MDFSQAFQGPVLVTIPGIGTVSFPRLTIRDYLAWTAELTAQRRDLARKAVPPTLQGIERFKVLRAVEFEEATLDDIAMLVATAAGSQRVLSLSLKKSGKSDQEAGQILDVLPAAIAHSVAMEVAALFELKEPSASEGAGKPASDPPKKPQTFGATGGDALPLTETAPTGG